MGSGKMEGTRGRSRARGEETRVEEESEAVCGARFLNKGPRYGYGRSM
jgi:hypothetical protein